jgi:tetratricopeptide (TPR) repeat protein
MQGCIHILLAHLHIQAGRFKEGGSALENWMVIPGGTSTSERATARYQARTLAQLEIALKDWTAAEKTLQALFNPDERDKGSWTGSIGQGLAYHLLACVWIERKRYDEARPITQGATLARRSASDSNREDYMLLQMDKLGAAIYMDGSKCYTTTTLTNMVSNTRAPTDLRVACNQRCLMGRVHLLADNLLEAKAEFEMARQIARTLNRVHSHPVRSVKFSLGYVLWMLGELDECVALKEQLEFMDLESGRNIENVGNDRAWMDKMVQFQKKLGAVPISER